MQLNPTPKVSVVMPVYNVEKYVADAIDSVLAQTFTDFELIIVDDDGSDRSMEICRSYDDPRIRIVSQRNRGLAGARNTGILASRGELVALLDSDDRWLPQKLELHVIHLDNNPGIGVSYSPSRFINAQGKRLRLLQKPKLADVTPADIFARNPVGNGSAPVLRRSALETIAFRHPAEPRRTCFFDEALRQSEDIELWLRLALLGEVQFAGIGMPLTEYRLSDGGLSAQVIKQYSSWQTVVERLQIYAPGFARQHVAKARAYQLRYLARRSVQLGDPNMAITLLKEAAASSKRPLLEEPVRTLVTLGAVLVSRLAGPERFAGFAARAAGGRLTA